MRWAIARVVCEGRLAATYAHFCTRTDVIETGRRERPDAHRPDRPHRTVAADHRVGAFAPLTGQAPDADAFGRWPLAPVSRAGARDVGKPRFRRSGIRAGTRALHRMPAHPHGRAGFHWIFRQNGPTSCAQQYRTT